MRKVIVSVAYLVFGATFIWMGWFTDLMGGGVSGKIAALFVAVVCLVGILIGGVERMIKRIFKSGNIRWEDFSREEHQVFGGIVGLWLLGLWCFGYGIYDLMMSKEAEILLVGVIAFCFSALYWMGNILGVYKRRSIGLKL